jgi:ABC-type polysaccharide/polyol phosphate transport system ATPase subunit
MNAIDAVDVTKIYRRYARRKQFATLKSALLSHSLMADLQPSETFPAIRQVSFKVAAGQTFGLIGRNGSGKSTMLKLVAGITKPTSGRVTVNGRISALIELGAGFHPEISGRENVFVNGIMLGLTKREVARRFDEIVEFAELQDFIDAPVKTYSSGMYLRLGFAVAIHVDPDVLLVDEVLAVGDEGFTHKCLDKFGEFRRRGKTVLLVTHSMGLVERFCDEALWLDSGEGRAQGDPRRIVGAYLASVERGEDALMRNETARAVGAAAGSATEQGQELPRSKDDGPGPETTGTTGAGASAELPQPSEPEDMFKAVEGRWGSREVEITDVAFLDRTGRPSFVFHTGEPLSIRLRVVAKQPTADFAFGIGVFNADGVCCYGTNTWLEEMRPDQLAGEAEVTFQIETLDFVAGTYKIDVAVHKCDGVSYDYHRLLYTFRVKSRTPDVGIYRPHHSWHFSPNVQFREVSAGAESHESPAADQAEAALLEFEDRGRTT